MRTCEAFATRGLEVTLASLKVRFPDAVRGDEIWSHFGIAPTFRVVGVPTPLTTRSSAGAQRTATTLASAGLTPWALGSAYARRRRLIIYARTPAMLAPFSAIRRLVPGRHRLVLVYETHTLPPTRARRIVGSADLVVVNSRRLEHDVATQLGLQPKRVLHAPLPAYAPTRVHSKENARRELVLPQEASIACYTGKMTDEQCGFLLRVGALIRDRIPGSLLVLVGGNPEILPRVKRRRDALGLRDAVLLSGFVSPATAALYQSAADVLLLYMDSDLPHFEYCTPAKGLDYQAAGRPIVARDLPLFEEVFGADGERAVRVSDVTPEGFAHAIERTLTLEDGGRAMTDRALAWIADRSWQARVDAVLDALDHAR
jgi:glycosyltransferase involved in cell wall biosynthesis